MVGKSLRRLFSSFSGLFSNLAFVVERPSFSRVKRYFSSFGQVNRVVSMLTDKSFIEDNTIPEEEEEEEALKLLSSPEISDIGENDNEIIKHDTSPSEKEISEEEFLSPDNVAIMLMLTEGNNLAKDKISPPEVANEEKVESPEEIEEILEKTTISVEKLEETPIKNTDEEVPPANLSEGEVTIEVTESLRWDAELSDPEEETKRMEEYRSNRRQRYVEHKQKMLKEAKMALRQGYAKAK